MAGRIDAAEIKRYGGLALHVRQVVEGFLTGIHRSPYKGSSVEFAEHRQYSPGDDIRHVDWRAVAKTDRYFVKEFEEETNLRAWIVVDASGSMAYKGKSALSKWEYARNTAAAISYLLLRQMDAVGLMVHDTRVRQLLPPKAHPRQFLRICKGLEAAKPGAETSLATAWEELAARHVKRRSLVILISDGIDKADAIRKALQRLRFQRQEVAFLQILAPEELDFPFQRTTQFRSLENDTATLAQPRFLREEYRKRFGAHAEALKTASRQLRIDFARFATDEPLERTLGAFLGMRERRAR